MTGVAAYLLTSLVSGGALAWAVAGACAAVVLVWPRVAAGRSGWRGTRCAVWCSPAGRGSGVPGAGRADPEEPGRGAGGASGSRVETGDHSDLPEVTV